MHRSLSPLPLTRQLGVYRGHSQVPEPTNELPLIDHDNLINLVPFVSRLLKTQHRHREAQEHANMQRP